MFGRAFWCRCVQVACICAATASIAGVLDEAHALKVVKVDPQAIVVPVGGTGVSTSSIKFVVADGKWPAQPPPREAVMKRSGHADFGPKDGGGSSRP